MDDFRPRHAGNRMTRTGALLLVILAFAFSAQWPVHAQTRKAISKSEFSFPAEGQVKIVLFRPDVAVGEQTTGGLHQPNAGWTEQARERLTTALEKAQAARNIEMKLMPELSGSDAKLMSDYRKLFRTVADSVIKHRLFGLDPLPTKADGFDWTLGPGASRLGALGQADYGLFFYTMDSYESASRRTARLIASSMGTGNVAEVNMGYAGLVDLQSGDLLWLNVDVKMAGDTRTPDGAVVRVAELLRDFPSRAAVAP
jgi:hypothetical protein